MTLPTILDVLAVPIVFGLLGLSRPGLTPTDRRIIGRYMLAAMAALAALIILVSIMHILIEG